MEAAAAAYLAICAAYNGSASGLKKHGFYKFVVVSGRVYNHVIALSYNHTKSCSLDFSNHFKIKRLRSWGFI